MKIFRNAICTLAISFFLVACKEKPDEKASLDFIKCYLKQADKNGHKLELKKDAKSMSLTNAHVMALLSYLAYADDDVIKEVSKDFGFTRYHVFNIHKSQNLFDNLRRFNMFSDKKFDFKWYHADTQGIWFENDDLAVLVFRGTVPLELDDVWTDLMFVEHDVSNDKSRVDLGRIHSGFYAALYVAWNDINNEIWYGKNASTRTRRAKALPLFVGGHSLGAALATIAVQKLHYHQHIFLKNDLLGRNVNNPLWDKTYVKALYTFGSPKVGDQQFVDSTHELFKEMQTEKLKVVNNNDVAIVPQPYSARFVNNNDLVPHAPLTGTLAGAFAHINNLFYFGNVGTILPRTEAQTAYDKVQAAFDKIGWSNFKEKLKTSLDDLGDHSMKYYVERTYSLLNRENKSGCL